MGEHLADDEGTRARDRELTRRVFQDCRELSALTGRPISPDGHLVGSLGELHAAAELSLMLLPPSTAGCDAQDDAGRLVEIKATTGRSVALSAHGTKAERLVIVTLDRATGECQIAYDGPADRAWNLAGAPQRNGQRRLSISRLYGEHA